MAPDEHPPPVGAAAEAAPDPEEDDLDDLDDVLDEFQNTKLDAKPTATSTSPSASGPGRPETTTASAPASSTAAIPPSAAGDAAPASVESDEDFAKQLQAGMAELLGELQANPDMAKQFEEMMGQFGGMPGLGGTAPTSSGATASKAAPSTTATSATKAGSTTTAGEDSFQDTIKRTMERMQKSDTSASAAASAPAGDDAMFAQLLKEFGSGEGGAGEDDAFSSMLLSMMEQLTNKEVLYEPMKELDAKFPAWLAEREPGAAKAGSVTEEELVRYRTQKDLVRDIVARFEQPSYNDNTPADREYIVDRMQKMQEAGAPPPELVGDANAAQAMLGDLDPEAGCPQQ